MSSAFADDADSEPVVAVTMCDIHRGQVLAGGRDPVGEGVALLEGHERVDQHSVTLTGKSVAEIGDQVRRLCPGARSSLTIDAAGATKMSQVRVPVRCVVTT